MSPEFWNNSNDDHLKLYERAKVYKVKKGNSHADDILNRLEFRFLQFMISSQIFIKHRNKTFNKYLREELFRYIDKGYTYKDIFSDSTMYAMYVHAWHKPNILSNLLLFLRRALMH